jgi:hypothetical protein
VDSAASAPERGVFAGGAPADSASAATAGGAPLLLATTPSAADAVASWGAASASGTGFTVRRVVNPRYRPPLTASGLAGPATTGALSALDHAHAQVVNRGAGPTLTREWEFAAGRAYRGERAFELSAAGATRDQASGLRQMRLDARDTGWQGSVGDVPPLSLGGVASLQRLRGALLHVDLPGGGVAHALGGGETPLPGITPRKLRLGGAALEERPFDEATVSASFLGFARGVAPHGAGVPADPDSMGGAGGVATFGIRAPLAASHVAFAVSGGYHNLDGERGLTARQALDWNLATPLVALALHDERASRRARIVGTETFLAAPRAEDRWNAQLRGGQGRLESHFTGVLRDGGDSSLAAHTVQLGGSGNLGASAWYAGIDHTWDRRGAPGIGERRLSVSLGNMGAGGVSTLLRADRTGDDAGRTSLALADETSLPLPRGGRVDVEPRGLWTERRFGDALVTTRLSWPMRPLSGRLTGALAVGASRDEGFRGRVREAELGFAFVPRPRDLGNVDVRRVSENGTTQYEYTAAYDVQAARYESAGGGFLARRDSNRVVVHVLRAGNRSGVGDALVSLDGKELRFTDADGLATFDRVAPGVHVVAIEERSLPVPYRVSSSTRVFVTVERGRLPDPVEFEIARPAKRQVFGSDGQ